MCTICVENFFSRALAAKFISYHRPDFLRMPLYTAHVTGIPKSPLRSPNQIRVCNRGRGICWNTNK